jgi:hypothetical protein
VNPSWVGGVQAGSPAQMAKAEKPEDNGLRVADEIISIDGKQQYRDWTKTQLYSALSAAGEEIPVVVKRGIKPDGTDNLHRAPRDAGESRRVRRHGLRRLREPARSQA